MIPSRFIYYRGRGFRAQTVCHFAAMSWWAYTPVGYSDVSVRGTIGFTETDRRTFTGLTGLEYVRARDAGGDTVAIAGTSALDQWLAYVIQRGNVQSTINPGQLFRVFDLWSNTIVLDLVDRADKDRQMALCGHSLGGALAVVVGMKLKALGWDVQVVHTFGCPKIGDEEFINACDIRVHNYLGRNDIVPALPPASFTTGRVLDQLGVVVQHGFRPPDDYQETQYRGDQIPFYQVLNQYGAAVAIGTLTNLQITAHSISTYLVKWWNRRNMPQDQLDQLSDWAALAQAQWGIDVNSNA